MSVSNLPGIFNKNVRPFLDAIDNLRQFGLDEDLMLPTVVVIGDQSSGKSSILEAISGVQLPRGTGMVTRCPLQLQMKQMKQSQQWMARLTYKNSENSPVENIMYDPREVDSAIRQAQDDMIGTGNTISDSLLSLTIEGADVPDLTLIDLPGIARVSVGDQSQNLPEEIRQLLRKFISRKESLLLTVCPCTTDLATTEALKLAQEYDPDCQRTFGVLTKADLIDKGSEDRILEILNNEVVPLVKGYTIVKCRSQNALQMKESLKESLIKEKHFFENHSVFRNLDKSQWGIETLSQKLATDLFNFIKSELPNTRESILKKQTSINDKLNQLVFDYPTTSEARLIFSLQTTQKFLSVFSDLTDGKYHSQELEDIENSMKKRHINPKINMRLIPHARKIFEHLQNNLTEVTPEYSLDSTIEKLLINSQGREPRDFLSFDTFRKIALKFIHGSKPHITQCMETIHTNLQFVLQHLLDHFFIKYPVFKSNLLILVMSSLKTAKKRCADDLELMINKEKVFFMMDKMYEEKIDTLETLQNVKYALRQDWLGYFAKPNQMFPFTPQETKKALPKYIVVYFMLAIRRITDYISQSIIYLLMTDLHATLKNILPPHAAIPDTYNLLEEATGEVEEKKKILKLKSEGLKKGIVEIERLLFSHNFSKEINIEVEYEKLETEKLEQVKVGSEEQVKVGSEEQVKVGSEEQVIVGSEEQVIVGSEEQVIVGSEEQVIVGSEEQVIVGSEEQVKVGSEGLESGIVETESPLFSHKINTEATEQKFIEFKNLVTQVTNPSPRSGRAPRHLSRRKNGGPYNW